MEHRLNLITQALTAAKELHSRLDKALQLAATYGGSEGDHHRAWVIDQMVRVLTGCNEELKEGISSTGQTYRYYALGESEEYRKFLLKATSNERYWDIGVPP